MDVDTAKCVAVGLPNVARLCATEQVPLSVFLLPGKAIRKRDIVAPSRQGRNSSTEGNSLSPVEKLGIPWTVRTVVRNERLHPLIAKSRVWNEHPPDFVGLHGTWNHSEWCAGSRFDEQSLEAGILWGVKTLRPFLSDELGFASPCSNTPIELKNVLVRNGFALLADEISPGVHRTTISPEGLRAVSTGICGPAGEGFLEYCTARRLSLRETMERFDEMLGEADNAVVYGHPFFDGDKGLSLLSEFVGQVKKRGHTWEPIFRGE